MVKRMAPALRRVGNARPPGWMRPAELLRDGYFRVHRQVSNQLVYVREGCTPADTAADVTFRCNASAYVLLTYGRLDLSGGAPATAQLEIDGPLEKALLFTTAFAGY